MIQLLGRSGSRSWRWRRTIAAAVAMAGAASLMWQPSTAALAAGRSDDAKIRYWEGINPVTDLTARTFAEPPANDRSWVRWNFPPATATIPELERELDQMASAGIAGVEVGQGGNPTNEQLSAILRKATPLGITVGIKYKGGAPVDGTWADTDDYSRKTLNNTRSIVNVGATFDGALPGTGTLVAALAYRCTAATCPATGKLDLDPSSVVDLTSKITGRNTDGFFDGSTTGTLKWTAPAQPAGGQWALITFRSVAVQAAPEVFSREGTDALIAGYEALWTPELKQLLRANRSDLFVDSHATDPWGTPLDLWSSNMARDFKRGAGYSITPGLAALFYADYTFSDGSDGRIRTDFYQVRSDLFIKNRIDPFTTWANTNRMTLRLQPEDPVAGGGDPPMQDPIEVASHLQRPEHESLAGGTQIDAWRPLASANHMNGNPWYSTECCAVSGQNYVETLQDVTVRMNKSYAGGITKNVYHVYPYAYGPTGTWPGQSNFGPTSFSGAWGPRNPDWSNDARTVNDWMARNQQVLTQGRADMDVAVYLHSFEWPNPASTNIDGSAFGKNWDDPALQRAGYTWDYLNPGLIGAPNAKVHDKQLATDGPSYRALVIDSFINTPAHPVKTAMPVDTAQRILGFARQGLPVVVVGDQPDQTPGNNGDDAKLRGIVRDLLKERTVHQVASEADVPAELARLDVRPDARPQTPSNLLSVHRADERTATDYYFLYNQGVDQLTGTYVFEEPEACRYSGTATNPCRAAGEAVDQLVTLKGEGRPYLLDAVSGKVTPIADYRTGRGTVTVRVKLDPDDSTIVALSGRQYRFGTNTSETHVEDTTADTAVQVGRSLVVRDTRPGTYRTRLSNGRTVDARISDVPSPIDLTGRTWQLAAEDWQPANPFGATGEAGAATTVHPVDVTLHGLAAWPDIPELADASGSGTYTTTVTLPKDWKAGLGAVLDLGQVVDTVELSVNGENVPVSQLTATAEVGPYLKAGANTISARVSTTLNNRLAAVIPAVRTRGIVQEYGLVGPVTLTPFGEATVWKDR